MTTIYAVTSGSYSDWHIMALFSTKEKAEEYRDTMSHAGGIFDKPNEEIDDYELDLPREKWTTYLVRISPNGDVVGAYMVDYYGESLFDARKNLVTFVRTDDPNRAIKVANERRTIILANNMWGDLKALDTLNF